MPCVRTAVGRQRARCLAAPAFTGDDRLLWQDAGGRTARDQRLPRHRSRRRATTGACPAVTDSGTADDRRCHRAPTLGRRAERVWFDGVPARTTSPDAPAVRSRSPSCRPGTFSDGAACREASPTTSRSTSRGGAAVWLDVDHRPAEDSHGRRTHGAGADRPEVPTSRPDPLAARFTSAGRSVHERRPRRGESSECRARGIAGATDLDERESSLADVDQRDRRSRGPRDPDRRPPSRLRRRRATAAGSRPDPLRRPWTSGAASRACSATVSASARTLVSPQGAGRYVLWYDAGRRPRRAAHRLTAGSTLAAMDIVTPAVNDYVLAHSEPADEVLRDLAEETRRELGGRAGDADHPRRGGAADDAGRG